MPKPLTPNYVPGVGRLTTYTLQFESHIDGSGFRQNATTIDLFPTLVITSGEIAGTYTTVQEIIGAMAANFPPTIPSATPSSLGIIQLSGDLGGTATSPQVIGLRGRPISTMAPASGQSLTWNGTAWAPAIVLNGDLTSVASLATVVSVSGDVAGILNIGGGLTTTTVNVGDGNSVNTVNIANGTNVSAVNIGANSIPGAAITLGNGSGEVIISNLAGFTNAMVIATSTGQLSLVPTVTYTFTGHTSLNVAAPFVTTSSISVGFTDVTPAMLTTAYTVDSGPTPDYVLLVEDNTPRVINLPAAVAGRVLKIKDAAGSAGDNNIVINAAGSDTFEDGSTSKTITVPFGVVELIAGTITAGTLWFITGVYNITITL
jgi:hypothetical protein